MSNRRSFLKTVSSLGAGLFVVPRLFAQHDHAAMTHTEKDKDMQMDGNPLMVQSPDIPNLAFEIDNGVKVFRLRAEVVERELIPGKKMKVWGYNGSCPGPTIQATQGERVRIIVENRLPEATTMHWHGFEIPVLMDGMPYISQKPILPGGNFTYEFTLHQEGTYFYHSHGAMQEMMGMIGMFILHPKKPYKPRVDHDYGIIMQGWSLLPNSDVPNTAGMEFNWLTFNGKAGPATTPLLARLGSRVRIRFVNMGMDHHPIHLHGNTFVVTGSEAGRQPETMWGPANTVLVGVAQARDIEFVANNPGDWMLHCHLPHHMMNSMMDLLGDRLITTSALAPKQADEQMGFMMASGLMEHSGDSHGTPVSSDATKVIGFPQDAYMEMTQDSGVGTATKPELHGLPPNWTAGMQGMMTLVRVLPLEMYDHIMALKTRATEEKPGQQPAAEHKHGKGA